MAQTGRSKPTLGEAMAALTQRPVMTLADYCEVAQVNRMTALKAANAGDLEGVFRVGKQFRVACAPWRRKLGVVSPPEPANLAEVA